MAKIKDLSGQKINMFTVVGLAFIKPPRGSYWECVCECGTVKTMCRADLLHGTTYSCGCYQKKKQKERYTTHGFSNLPEYRTWLSIKARCYNSKQNTYKFYGAKGIRVCGRWLNSFENFYEDMGPKPSKKHSIDRYPDKDGNYELGNCRWATREVQDRNRTDNVWIEYNGEKMVLADWAKRIGIEQNLLGYYIKHLTIPEIIEYIKYRNILNERRNINKCRVESTRCS